MCSGRCFYFILFYFIGKLVTATCSSKILHYPSRRPNRRPKFFPLEACKSTTEARSFQSISPVGSHELGMAQTRSGWFSHQRIWLDGYSYCQSSVRAPSIEESLNIYGVLQYGFPATVRPSTSRMSVDEYEVDRVCMFLVHFVKTWLYPSPPPNDRFNQNANVSSSSVQFS